MVVITTNAVITDGEIMPRIAGSVVFAAIAVLEFWIGRGVLRRRRWFLGVAFTGIFLALALVFAVLPDGPPEPLFWSIYTTATTILWALIFVALLWHRPWFSGTR